MDDATVQISQAPNSLFPKKRSLEHITDCQKIIRRGRFSGRGQILITLQPSRRIDHTLTIDTSSTLYKTWILDPKFQTLLNMDGLQFLHTLL